jgi:hypothetical protein
MSAETFNAARWTEAVEALGFHIHVVMGTNGKAELEIIVPEHFRNPSAEVRLWSQLRPNAVMAKYNEEALCQYLNRTGRTVRVRESFDRSNVV